MAPTEAGSAVEADGRCCGGVPEQVQMGAPPPLSTESGQPAGPCEALRAAEEPPAGGCAQPAPDEESAVRFPAEDTIFIFDWDDTVLPSTWVQCQGLRLDGSSVLTGAQREELAEVARVAGETLAAAKQHGTVVLVTNAQRGWIELSCQKFMPSLVPVLENVKLLSARTAYESAEVSSPLEWKLRAFEAEIGRIYRPDGKADSDRAWNVLSLGDSLHEREVAWMRRAISPEIPWSSAAPRADGLDETLHQALLRATAEMPNCRSKSLKFVERPDVAQICKQHTLVTSAFQQILHHDGNLDLCIRCE